MNLGPIIILTLVAITPLAYAQSLSDSNLNEEGRIPVAEGAWAANPSGLGIHLGIMQPTYQNSEGKWVHVGVVKGIYWPFTVGFHFSSNEAILAHQVGGWGQYSVYQQPMLPSAAIRLKYSKSYFGSAYTVDSKTGELIVSYGIGPISVTASQEFSSNHLQNLDPLENSAENSYLLYRTYGATFQLAFPSKISLTKTISSTGKSAVLTQMSFEI
ncbi:MAG: hypothetical protein WCI18_14035 [Pseudomonadota bacterium]